MRSRWHLAPFVVGVVFTAALADAQPLGTFRWQLSPYCNVVTLQVTQTASVYTLDGFDDLCGAPTRASAVGIAFPNPDGSIGLGLTLVQVPGGSPVHLDVAMSPATISGTWRDSAGNSGPFVFNPPSPASGPTRPATGGLSGVAVTAVTPGAGLIGGGTNGTVALSVAFGGSGAANAAARSDHTHGLANGNTGVGDGVLASNTSFDSTAIGFEALRANTTGTGNTAVGREALEGNTTGGLNTAAGYQALRTNTSGLGNVAVGYIALDANSSGDYNTALGRGALGSNTSGDRNVAVGAFALDASSTGSSNVAIGDNVLGVAPSVSQTVAIGRDALGALFAVSGQNTAIGDAALEALTAGSSNVAIGAFVGSDLTSGSRNIYLGTTGAAVESDTIRIGTPYFTDKVAAYIGGIHGSTVSAATDLPVLVDSSGKLGTVMSTQRVKEDIRPLVDVSAVQRLRPVSFRYRPEQGRGDALQYGLIAEEVADIMPELAVLDTQGNPISVRYHVLTPLLLAEVQRLERERAALVDRVEALARDLAALAAGRDR
jgi:hypothetical protein